ncbi:MAG: LicD family protein [Prevotella sp.]|nr:LicD family protein [Prevotella sp.]
MRERGTESNALHQLTSIELALLHKTLFEMLTDIMNACKQIGIECTLIGGSVLGAIRHQGFIPWDDDLDIGITRKEWEVLKCHFKALLGEKYVLEAPNYDNKDSKQLLSKIYLKDSEWVMIEEMSFPYHNSIYIDVFIIDGVSNNRIVRLFDASVANFLRAGAISMQEYKYPSPILKEAMLTRTSTKLYYYIRQFVGLCFSVVSHKALCDFFDHFVSRHRSLTQSSTVATGLKKYKAETLRNEVWFPYSKGVFNGMEVNLPHDPDKYLTYIYGDYMKLPPVEKRETHPVVKFRFPNK